MGCFGARVHPYHAACIDNGNLLLPEDIVGRVDHFYLARAHSAVGFPAVFNEQSSRHQSNSLHPYYSGNGDIPHAGAADLYALYCIRGHTGEHRIAQPQQCCKLFGMSNCSIGIHTDQTGSRIEGSNQAPPHFPTLANPLPRQFRAERNNDVMTSSALLCLDYLHN